MHRVLPFSEEQDQTLSALIERILPADDEPGGLELGVKEFVWRRVCESHEALNQLRATLMAFESEKFAEVPSDVQDEICSRFEAHPGFLRLVDWVIEGAFADPSNGGNLGEQGWKMVGFRVSV